MSASQNRFPRKKRYEQKKDTQYTFSLFALALSIQNKQYIKKEFGRLLFKAADQEVAFNHVRL